SKQWSKAFSRPAGATACRSGRCPGTAPTSSVRSSVAASSSRCPPWSGVSRRPGTPSPSCPTWARRLDGSVMSSATDRVPTFADVREAAARLRGHVVRTPLLRHPVLDALTGGTVLVKPEPLQLTGSFKLRGAMNAALRMPPATRRGGIVSFSSGNHGQATAAAAHLLGMAALIAMPQDAPTIKVESTKRWGAEVVFFERRGTDRNALSARLSAERGATVIPPFDHPDVIAGQGTVALELVEDARAVGHTLDAL